MYELAPNTKLQNGKYRIVKKLSQGTFGITYLAIMHEHGDGCEMDIEIAIKEFFMKETNNREGDSLSVTGSESELFKKYREKFKTEANNLAKMSSFDDIVKIYDVFEENNTAYFAMEYIEGCNLDEYIAQCGKLSESQATDYIKAIAVALRHLHENNMLHLDLKPKNVMRRIGGKLFLIDFGLSKQYDNNGEAESSSTIGLGTPGYAPIEQANFKGGFEPTLDIYALGATFYKMLTGKSAPQSIDIFNTGFEPLKQKMESNGVSSKTISIVQKAMDLKKNNRYQNVNEFLNCFEAVANGDTSSASSVPNDSTIEKPSSKPKIKKIIFIVLGLLIGAFGAYWLTKYCLARGDSSTYYSYIRQVENTIRDLKANERAESSLVADYYEAQQYMDEILSLEDKHPYFSPYTQGNWFRLFIEIGNAWDEFVENKPPIIVKDIQIGNKTNGEIIDDYGSTLHASDIYYLAARLKIYCIGDYEGYLYVKIYEDGYLDTNFDSPSGYTYKQECEIYSDEESSYYYLLGWGSEKGGSYTGVSSVRWEIWLDNKKIAEKTIQLLE
ncbi:MAG: serine/threonine protein kinase [Bacteroidales bacterium]|nr:serine/threonine protein kinase [Bacteroidales bacterium]